MRKRGSCLQGGGIFVPGLFASRGARHFQAQALDGPAVAEMLFHQLGHILQSDVGVPNAFGINDEGGSHVAGAQARCSCNRCMARQIGGVHRFVQRLNQIDASLGLAAPHRMILGALIDANKNMTLDMFHCFPLSLSEAESSNPNHLIRIERIERLQKKRQVDVRSQMAANVIDVINTCRMTSMGGDDTFTKEEVKENGSIEFAILLRMPFCF